MPNHVTNRFTITGPRQARLGFKRAFLTETREPGPDGQEILSARFDFERIIPMPEVIRGTESSSSVSTGLLVLGRPEIQTDGFGTESLEDKVACYLAYPWVKAAAVHDYEGLKALLIERDPSCVAKAEIAIRAYEECGHASWYSWSLANWGAKWNSYSFRLIAEDDDLLDFSIDTAWSPPEPIFAALTKRPECANLKITVRCFDEGWMFACKGVIAEGHYLLADVKPDPAFYEEVYGVPCTSEKDEEATQA